MIFLGLKFVNVKIVNVKGNDLPHSGQNVTEAAKAQRSVVADYCCKEGSVPW